MSLPELSHRFQRRIQNTLNPIAQHFTFLLEIHFMRGNLNGGHHSMELFSSLLSWDCYAHHGGVCPLDDWENPKWKTTKKHSDRIVADIVVAALHSSSSASEGDFLQNQIFFDEIKFIEIKEMRVPIEEVADISVFAIFAEIFHRKVEDHWKNELCLSCLQRTLGSS
jgi:hypothetical protein